MSTKSSTKKKRSLLLEDTSNTKEINTEFKSRKERVRLILAGKVNGVIIDGDHPKADKFHTFLDRKSVV